MADFKFILVGPDTVEELYSTDSPEWSGRLADYLRQDWSGRKSEYEGFRNAREVVVVAVDEKVFGDAIVRADTRRCGVAPKPVTIGQRFPTLSRLAEQLGVTVGMVGKSFDVERRATVRGVTVMYLDEYLVASEGNVRD
jgi:hypothetical protein